MSDPKATTMELPVKLVRKIAQLAFNSQCDVLQKDVEKIAADENARIEIANRSFLRSLGVFKMETPYNMATIYQDWKELYLSGKMRGDHPAIDAFWRNRSSWWKRLRQFADLPEQDDERMIRMSLEDLDLIDYSHFLEEATKLLAAKEE